MSASNESQEPLSGYATPAQTAKRQKTIPHLHHQSCLLSAFQAHPRSWIAPIKGFNQLLLSPCVPHTTSPDSDAQLASSLSKRLVKACRPCPDGHAAAAGCCIVALQVDPGPALWACCFAAWSRRSKPLAAWPRPGGQDPALRRRASDSGRLPAAVGHLLLQLGPRHEPRGGRVREAMQRSNFNGRGAPRRRVAMCGHRDRGQPDHVPLGDRWSFEQEDNGWQIRATTDEHIAQKRNRNRSPPSPLPAGGPPRPGLGLGVPAWRQAGPATGHDRRSFPPL